MSKSHPRWRLAKKILTWLFFIAVAVLLVVYAQKVDWEEVTELVDSSFRLIASKKLIAKKREAVEAEVIPEHITMNATRKVTNWTPKALCAYSAAPAACGYLVTSSR